MTTVLSQQPSTGCSCTTTSTPPEKLTSTKNCAPEVTKAVQEQLHAGGGWTDPIEVHFIDAFRRSELPDSVVIQVDYERSTFVQYHGDGKTQNYAQEQRWAAVELNYKNGQWVIVRQKDEESN